MRASLIALALVATACSTDATPSASSSPSTSPSPTATATGTPTESPTTTPDASPTKKKRTGTRIQAHSSAFGRILFGSTGQAIYMFAEETTRKPRCYGACEDAWPPVLTRGTPVALKGVDQDLLGTTKRRDGSRQVTYRGHPLYFYAHEGRYEVKCHDVYENGGYWYALQPDGRRAP